MCRRTRTVCTWLVEMISNLLVGISRLEFNEKCMGDLRTLQCSQYSVCMCRGRRKSCFGFTEMSMLLIKVLSVNNNLSENLQLSLKDEIGTVN